MYILYIMPSHLPTCQRVSIFSYVGGFWTMRVHQLIVEWFKQAFRKMFRILHTSRIRKGRHKDPSCVSAPSVGLVIVVPHCVIGSVIAMVWTYAENGRKQWSERKCWYDSARKKTKGRPRGRWVDCIRRDMHELRITPEDSQDRTFWKSRIRATEPT